MVRITYFLDACDVPFRVHSCKGRCTQDLVSLFIKQSIAVLHIKGYDWFIKSCASEYNHALYSFKKLQGEQLRYWLCLAYVVLLDAESNLLDIESFTGLDFCGFHFMMDFKQFQVMDIY